MSLFRRTRREHRGYDRWVLLCIFLLIPGIMIPLAMRRRELATRMDAALAELKDQGYPTEMSGLNAWYPDAEWGANAADMLAEPLKAIKLAPREDDPYIDLLEPVKGGPPASEPFSAEATAAHKRHVASNLVPLLEVMEALEEPTCRWPIDLSMGYATLLEHISPYEYVTTILGAVAAIKTAEGDSEGTCRAILASMRLAQTLQAEPLFVSQNSRHRNLRIPLWHLKRALHRSLLDEPQLEQIARELDELASGTQEGYRRALAAEICMLQCSVRMMASGQYVIPAARVPIRARFVAVLYHVIGVADADVLYHLELARPVLDTFSQPIAEHAEAGKRLRATSCGEPPAISVYPGMVMHDWVDPLDWELAVLTRIRLAQAAVAVERYRLRTGQFPESLNELPEDLRVDTPADLYSGELFQYRRQGNGFVLYSVGPDGDFDPGEEPFDHTGTRFFRVIHMPREASAAAETAREGEDE